MKQGLSVLILAARKGTRFKSKDNKVLHPILGKSLLWLGLDCVLKLKPEKIYVVVGYQKEEVIKEALLCGAEFIIQREQRGTAYAVLAARHVLNKAREKDVLIMNADLPLLSPSTLKKLLNLHSREGNALSFLMAELDNPAGYSRITRSEGSIKVVKEADASSHERKINEVDAGVYLFNVRDLLAVLPEVFKRNRKGEYNLSDIVEILSKRKKRIGICKAARSEEVVSVNSRYELAWATDVLRKRKIKALAEHGVTVYDPQTAWIDLDVRIGQDTTLYSSVIIEGNSVIGRQCQLYPFVHIIDSRVANRVKILSSTMIEKSVIEDDAQVGPFTHLRPNTVIRSGARVGNFVEMKNTIFGRMSKAGHLSYLGDCEVKEDVNIGAGTITCNYDGKKKQKTQIEAGAFIGSGTELVAPVKVGRKAYIGAGSTITKNVSPEALAVARCKQIEKKGWARRKRGK